MLTTLGAAAWAALPGPHSQAAGAVAQGFAEGGPVGAALAAAQLGVQALTAVIGNFASGAQMALNDVRDAFKDMSDDIFSGEMDITVAVNIATIKKSNWWGGYDREATKEAQEEAQEHYDYMRGLQANFLAAGYDAEHHMAWERRRLAATTNEELIALNQEMHEAGLQAYANVELLGGPTGEAIQDFHRLNEAWGHARSNRAGHGAGDRKLRAEDAGGARRRARADRGAARDGGFGGAAQPAVGRGRTVGGQRVRPSPARRNHRLQRDHGGGRAVPGGGGGWQHRPDGQAHRRNGGWVASTEDAHARATAAQESSIEQVLAAEGEKFARMAAFEAALEAVRSGNAEGATEAAARKAAEETRLAWDTAMDAVTLADQAATDAMDGTTSESQTKAQAAAEAKQLAEMEAAKGAADAWELAKLETIEDADATVVGIKEALDELPESHEIAIKYYGVQTGDHSAGGAPQQFAGGSGGIRDFGTGTPATLHGREGVFTEAQIQRLIDAAIKRGGSGGGGGHVTATLRSEDGRYLAELVLENTPDAAERLGLT